MGVFYQEDHRLVYRQDDGEVTAWLNDFEEKEEIGHKGSPRYRKIFHFLVSVGVIYLIFVFAFY